MTFAAYKYKQKDLQGKLSVRPTCDSLLSRVKPDIALYVNHFNIRSQQVVGIISFELVCFNIVLSNNNSGKVFYLLQKKYTTNHKHFLLI